MSIPTCSDIQNLVLVKGNNAIPQEIVCIIVVVFVFVRRKHHPQQILLLHDSNTMNKTA